MDMGTRHPSGPGPDLEAGGKRRGHGCRLFPGVELLSVESRTGSPTEAGTQVEALDEASWGVDTSPREKLPDIYILDKLV